MVCSPLDPRHISECMATTDALPAVQLRYVGLGNLVVVPVSLAVQWEAEIARLTTQKQRILVLDGLKERRFFMSTKEGLAACDSLSQ
jgi:hypothetical protein